MWPKQIRRRARTGVFTRSMNIAIPRASKSAISFVTSRSRPLKTSNYVEVLEANLELRYSEALNRVAATITRPWSFPNCIRITLISNGYLNHKTLSVPGGSINWQQLYPCAFTPREGCLSTLNVRLDILDGGMAPIPPSHHLFQHVAGGHGNVKNQTSARITNTELAGAAQQHALSNVNTTVSPFTELTMVTQAGFRHYSGEDKTS